MRFNQYNTDELTLPEKVERLRLQLEKRFPVSLSLYLRANDEILSLDLIEIEKERRDLGIGSKVMDVLVAFADKHQLVMALTPIRDARGSRERLVRFYQRWNFIPNVGRNKDFRVMAGMIRLPKN